MKGSGRWVKQKSCKLKPGGGGREVFSLYIQEAEETTVLDNKKTVASDSLATFLDS